MNEGWIEVSVGAFCAIVKGRKPKSTNKVANGLPYLVAEFLRGGVPTLWVDSEEAVVISNSMDTLLLWDGAGAGDIFQGREGVVASTMARVRTTSEQLDSSFLRLNLEANKGSLKSSNRGTTVPHVSPEALRSIAFFLPPLPVQLQIVDLIAHLDNHLINMRSERNALVSVMAGLLQSWDEGLAAISTVDLGDCFLLRSGASWSAKEESKEPVEGSLRVVKITNTRSDGSLDLSEETYVRGLSESQGVLSDRSLIIIRTNGNRNRIGNVYRASPASFGCAVSAFQFFVEAPTTLDRDWLYWWLRVPSRQTLMTEAASGSTGLGNLAASWLKKLQVPWPNQSEKQTQVDLFASVEVPLTILSAEIQMLGRVRNLLLSNLLSGDVVIPGGYDILLNQVA